MASRVIRRWSLAVGAVAASSAGCSTTTALPNVPLPYVAASQSCGPADGPAVEIVLSSNPDVASQNPSYPLVRVMIFVPLQQARGKTIPLDGNNGFAHYATSVNAYTGATRGTVTLDATIGQTVSGTMDLTFPNRDPVRGRFSAVWLERAILCG